MTGPPPTYRLFLQLRVIRTDMTTRGQIRGCLKNVTLHKSWRSAFLAGFIVRCWLFPSWKWHQNIKCLQTQKSVQEAVIKFSSLSVCVCVYVSHHHKTPWAPRGLCSSSPWRQVHPAPNNTIFGAVRRAPLFFFFLFSCTLKRSLCKLFYNQHTPVRPWTECLQCKVMSPL